MQSRNSFRPVRAGLVVGFLREGGPSGSSQIMAAPQYAACMTGWTKGGAGGQKFVIPARDDRVQDISATGFVAQDCTGKQNSVPKFRNDICRFAGEAPDEVPAEYTKVFGIAPQGVQHQFTADYGATPRELCTMSGGILGN